MAAPKDPEKRAEWKRKQSEAQKGKRGPNSKKKQLSEEHKAKLAIKSSGRKKSDEEKSKIGESQAKTHASMTNETKIAKSEKYREWYNSLSEEKRIEFLKPWIDAGMSSNKTVSKKEKELGKYLKSNDLEFETQKMIGQYYVDFFVSSHNLVIEFNGCFWHQCEKCGYNGEIRGIDALTIREYDKKRIDFLESQGYKVKIIWEHDLDKIIKNVI